MQKRLIQATATALLFATCVVPVYAHGNENKGGRGNEKAHNSSESEHGDRGLHLGWFKFGGSVSVGADAEADATCIANAKTAKKNAMTLAQDAYNDALAVARTAYLNAEASATQTRSAARLSARTTFLASDKGFAAWSAYLSARRAANTSWNQTVRAAKATWDSAKAAARSTMETAKAKAIADLQAAEAACSTSNPSSTDTTAPSAVTNLSLSGVTASAVTLSWTAPGDDGALGTATSYDVRYATSPITAANFASATVVTGEPAPAVAGTSQSMTVSGLGAGTTYYFALKTTDNATNVSAISNVPGITTISGDTVAPAAVTDLSLSGVTASAVTLNWSAPGDDNNVGIASSYDVRYSTSAITAANFGAATAATGEPVPGVAGTVQSMTVSGLNANTTYFFALKATDDASNVAAISNVASVQTAP